MLESHELPPFMRLPRPAVTFQQWSSAPTVPCGGPTRSSSACSSSPAREHARPDERVALDAVLDEVVGSLVPTAEAENIYLSLQPPPDCVVAANAGVLTSVWPCALGGSGCEHQDFRWYSQRYRHR